MLSQSFKRAEEREMRKGWGLVFAGLVLLMAATGAFCEVRLAGIIIGDPPRRLMDSPVYGPPDAILSASGVLNPLKPLPLMGIGAAMSGGLPAWAFAVRFQGLAPNQAEWIYNRDPVAIGFVITGEGLDAQVTSIAVSCWRKETQSRVASTAKGIRLGDTFAKVLLRYGFPRSLVVVSVSPVGGMTGMLPGRGPGALPSPSAPAAPGAREEYMAREIPLQALPYGVGPPSAPYTPTPGAGPMPLTPGSIPMGEAVEYDGQLQVTLGGVQRVFSRHMEIGYPGIDFTIHDMKVIRIHAYG
jgi:hypothetical protein